MHRQMTPRINILSSLGLSSYTLPMQDLMLCGGSDAAIIPIGMYLFFLTRSLAYQAEVVNYLVKLLFHI